MSESAGEKIVEVHPEKKRERIRVTLVGTRRSLKFKRVALSVRSPMLVRIYIYIYIYR